MSFQAYIDNIKAKTGKTPERGPSRDANLVEQSPTSEQAIKRIEFGKISAGRLWIGWFISGLTAAFMLFDAGAKFAKPAQVTDARLLERVGPCDSHRHSAQFC